MPNVCFCFPFWQVASIVDCSQLTDMYVARLSMPHLPRLCLNNAHISVFGVAQFIEKCPVLLYLDLREYASLDLTQLLVKAAVI